VFLQNEMPAQAGASLAVLAETAQAIGKPVLAADYCLRCFALVSEEKQDFMMFTWWECLKEMEAPDQIVNLNHLLRLYYPPGKKKREWSTPEGLIRLALAERFYGMHQVRSICVCCFFFFFAWSDGLRSLARQRRC
jgi:hypothetical protein